MIPQSAISRLANRLYQEAIAKVDVLVPKLERVETTLRTAWVRRLSMQVEVLPEFDDSFREVKRLMREFDALRGFGTC